MLWWSREEEHWNIATHALALVAMIVLGIYGIDEPKFKESTLFQKGIFLVYFLYCSTIFLVSCFYHYETNLEKKLTFRHLDQSMSIFMVPFVQIAWILYFDLGSLEVYLATIPIMLVAGVWTAIKLWSMNHNEDITHKKAALAGVLLATPSLYVFYQLYELGSLKLVMLGLLGAFFHTLALYFFINDSKEGKSKYHIFWHVFTGLGILIHSLMLLV